MAACLRVHSIHSFVLPGLRREVTLYRTGQFAYLHSTYLHVYFYLTDPCQRDVTGEGGTGRVPDWPNWDPLSLSMLCDCLDICMRGGST